jgi:hypothetical protein
MSPVCPVQHFEVNSTDNWQRYISHGHSGRGMALERPEMSMPVNDEVRRPPIEDNSQFAIAEHPVLSERLSAERSCGRSKVKRRDVHVRVEGQQRTLECLTLAAGPNREAFEGPGMDRRWPLARPEAAATAGRAGNADARSVRQANHRRAAVQHVDATSFESTAESYPTHRSQVVIA